MTIIVTYRVNQALYHASAEKHDISLITTEYKHGNDLLVHLQIGKNLDIHLNERLTDLLPDGFQDEQFLLKKTYNQGDFKLITRSTFNEKLSRFNLSQTVIEREILEKYTYTDKRGKPDEVHIVMLDRGDETVATIDFRDAARFESFNCPSWLIRLG